MDSATDFFGRLDLPVAEQLIDVPKISSSLCPSRAVLREPQMAEQLVDVPIQHIVELLLNHPVPQVGFACGGQQGVLSGQGSVGEQIVDVPAASRGFSCGLQGFLPRQSTSQRTAEQIADTLVLGGVRHGFPPGLHPSALPAVLPGEPVQGFFFRTFPWVKKSAALPPHSGSELPPHSSPWTPAAYAVPMGHEEEKEEEVTPDSIEFVQLSEGDTKPTTRTDAPT